jgi:hypothetical protein
VGTKKKLSEVCEHLNSIRQYESHIDIQMAGCMIPGRASRMPRLGHSRAGPFTNKYLDTPPEISSLVLSTL